MASANILTTPMPTKVIHYAHTIPSEIEILTPILGQQTSLEGVIDWITEENLEIVQMLNQDEFTSDIVVKLHKSLYLVYDVS